MYPLGKFACPRNCRSHPGNCRVAGTIWGGGRKPQSKVLSREPKFKCGLCQGGLRQMCRKPPASFYGMATTRHEMRTLRCGPFWEQGIETFPPALLALCCFLFAAIPQQGSGPGAALRLGAAPQHVRPVHLHVRPGDDGGGGGQPAHHRGPHHCAEGCGPPRDLTRHTHTSFLPTAAFVI